ncbi:MAG TPA: hypothetical protein VMU63_10960 [Acidimicrobiales bacterium]|nr:hypothetical protein [Acidimicrobiales bacterium]
MTGKPRAATFLPAAVQDLERLRGDDPALPGMALRKVRDLEVGEIEGQPLQEMAVTGDLADCRKVYFGQGNPPSHRIVYRQLDDGAIDVLEIVAVEAREEMYAYLLAAVRLGRLPEESRPRFKRLHQAAIERRSSRRQRK